MTGDQCCIPPCLSEEYYADIGANLLRRDRWHAFERQMHLGGAKCMRPLKLWCLPFTRASFTQASFRRALSRSHLKRDLDFCRLERRRKCARYQWHKYHGHHVSDRPVLLLNPNTRTYPLAD